MAHRILIVDDERDCRSVVALYFDRLGYETLQAEDSAQAISKTIDEQPDVIVTDLWLPDMNGIEATVALKRDPYTSKISCRRTYGGGGCTLERRSPESGGIEIYSQADLAF